MRSWRHSFVFKKLNCRYGLGEFCLLCSAPETCAGNSRYVLPSRYDADAPMSRATFNRITTAIAERRGPRLARCLQQGGV